MVVVECRRAFAATQRYDQLKRDAHSRQHPADEISRQVFEEFYADEWSL
jgi:hypothetical protein